MYGTLAHASIILSATANYRKPSDLLLGYLVCVIIGTVDTRYAQNKSKRHIVGINLDTFHTLLCLFDRPIRQTDCQPLFEKIYCCKKFAIA